MKKSIIIFIFIFFFTGVYASEQPAENKNDSSTDKDTMVLNSYTDEEFKKAVMQVLQKGNLTNKELFFKELEAAHKGNVEEEEQLFGLDNINKENAKGMNGWDVALSGIIVVFSGLILIMLVLYVFNFMFKPKTAEKAKPENARKIVEDTPEDILIAIATTVELYTRLYSSDILTDLSFKTTESESWKIKNKFVQGS
ncbi:MAG: OadG family protein [Candidatus Delongbacteria bacterium]|nr:OadG family protein [Candidatus Delongbacteria bacterium]